MNFKSDIHIHKIKVCSSESVTFGSDLGFFVVLSNICVKKNMCF